MIFTQQQIDEIRLRLATLGAKDTQFTPVSLPLNGGDIVAVVQQGENKQISINDFYEQLFHGSISYNAEENRIEFLNTLGDVLAYIDTAPFLEDLVKDVYIDPINRNIVIQYNNENKENTLISLNYIFNPQNYYTRSETYSKEETYNKTEISQTINTLASSLNGRIKTINDKIPTVASSRNQLADKAYVNDKVATNTATFKGTFNLVNDLELTLEDGEEAIAEKLQEIILDEDNNDYCYIQIPTSEETPLQIQSVERFKYIEDGDSGTWAFEFDLNNSGYTAEEWAAIQSGITSGLVNKLADLPTSQELSAALGNKANASDIASINNQSLLNGGNINVQAVINELNKLNADLVDDTTTTNKFITATERTLWNTVTDKAPLPFVVTCGIDPSDVSYVNSTLDEIWAAYRTGKNIRVKFAKAGGVSFEDDATLLLDGSRNCVVHTVHNGTHYTITIYEDNNVTKLSYAETHDSDKQDVISDLSAIRSGAAAGATAYQKPSSGIPASDIAAGVIPDVSNFITNSVNNLVNYYTKSETYTQSEVDALIGNIQKFHYEIYASLQDITTPATNVLYLIGPSGSGNDKYEEYVYANNAFVKIGDTSIDLSNYVTTQALNTALANYTTTTDLNTLLSAKQDAPSVAGTQGQVLSLDAQGNPVWTTVSPSGTMDTEMSDLSTNPVQNKVIKEYVDSLGIFDISSYHATGGVLAKYADLTAALGTNGANIPEAIRKGGMSVKFVQSSDNKYVQYRLTSISFNIVETNWVEDNIELLDFKVLGGYSAISPTVTLNKMYVDANLKIIDLSSAAGTYNMELYCYEVTKGQIIRINILKTTGFGKVLSFFYNLPAANVIGGSFVDGITNNQPLVDYLYTSPDDGYLCVGYNTTENSPTAEVYIQGLENLEGRVSDIEEELASEVEIDSDASAYAYVATDKRKYAVVSSSTGFKSKIYSIIKNKTYRYYIADTKSGISIPISFFEEIPSNGDAVYSALDVQGGSGIAAEGTFIAPINGYVCLCGNKNKGFSLVQVKGTIDNRISAIKAEVDGVKESSVSRKELYAEGETVYELPDELIGTSLYTGQTGCGIVHKAAEREVFNRITCCICRPQTANTGTFAIYKSSSTPNINNAESILSIVNFSSDNFAVAGELFTIDFDNDVVLEEDEYLFTYFSGICSLYLYETATRSDESEREGFVFHGSYNTYRYSSSITLSTRDGDIVALQKAVEGESTEDVKITLPDDLYCIKRKPQWFYYNNFIFGKESVYGNNVENYHIEVTAANTSIGTEKEDGFCIEANTTGNYSIEIRIYDQEMNFIVSKTVTVHVVESDNTLNGSNILMLGDSWTDPSIPIAAQSPAKGYTAETDAALKELGLTLNFVGSIDCGVNGLKNEGRGGYAWDTYSKAPTQVRFKFFVETMPNVSIGDVYTNNGSSYTVFEKGDGYITMTRTSGTSIPSGNTLTKSSGSGDTTITFTSYSQTTGNPFWNPTEGKVDFTYWRNLIGLEETLDFVTIQLGVNDCLGAMKTTKGQWKDNLDGASTIIDAILDDSPSCKVIVNLVGLDAPSNTAWSSLNGLSSSKATYQKNVYYLRKYINEMLAERDDFGTSVFIGQSVLGMNRWFGYEYSDKRDVYFQINTQTLDPTILNNLRNKTYTFFRADNVFLRLYGYDERGYAILRPFLGTSWIGRDQEFVGSQSEFDFSTIPATGNLVLDADHSVVIPYSAVRVENDSLKIHYFANATHPHARGYREMARTLVAQIISI